MVNLIGLCNFLRLRHPEPSSSKEIYQSVVEFTKISPEKETCRDAMKTLLAFWERNGWAVDPIGAVLLQGQESVLFNQEGLTIFRFYENRKEVIVMPVSKGQDHSKVIWF